MPIINRIPRLLAISPQIHNFAGKKAFRSYSNNNNTMGNIIQRSEETKIVNVNVHDAIDLLRSGHHYLDVRTEDEFSKGQVDVEKCSNIPYYFFTLLGRVKNTKFLEQVSSVCSKDDPIIVGCQSGVRSAMATTELVEAGFNNVSNMKGGYAAWTENKLSAKKSKSEL